ncbi:MAG: prephenate dehydrogenase [Lachnospiraceae bacterium]|nr:prephenate dehydrogenase [Lachnospiraceae bacterium]
MLINRECNILIVGLGLIGGSYARGLKKLGFHVSAVTRNPATIEYALKHHIIDEGTTDIDPQMIGKADIVVFSLYPHVFKEWIAANQQFIKPGALITDVTGVKSCIVYDIQASLRDDLEFIAAHPMAGKEVYGVENSDEKIFYGANFIIVPTDKNTEEAIEICREMALLLQFGRISVLSPEEHDEMIGFVSQLTHCIAVTLMNCSDNELLVNYVGDSFRDLTRIARINEDMWSELFLLNKESLLREMDKFLGEFKSLRDELAADDTEGMKEKMRVSTKRRALFDKPV